MTERKLKLVKSKNGYRPRRSPKPESLVLSPAEAAEAARFKALTAARAARQAMLRRIMAEFEELDRTSPAA